MKYLDEAPVKVTVLAVLPTSGALLLLRLPIFARFTRASTSRSYSNSFLVALEVLISPVIAPLLTFCDSFTGL